MSTEFWRMLLEMLEEAESVLIDNKDGYFAQDVCADCGGNCCKHYPCMNIPSDFKFLTDTKKTDEEKVTKMLEVLDTGMYSIDTARGVDFEYGPLNPKTKKPVWEKIQNGSGYLLVRARAKGQPIFDSQLLYPEPIRDYLCANWTLEDGCCLKPGEDEEYRRPFTGRMLKPMVFQTTSGEPYRQCVPMYDEEEFLNEWIKYQEILWRVWCELDKRS